MKTIRKLLFGLPLLGFPGLGFAQGTVVYTSNPVIVKGMKNQGTYASGTTYSLNDVVVSSGSSYLSLVNSNVGHTPSSSPTQWQPIGSAVALPSTTSVLKGNGSGGAVAAAAGTDYATPASVTTAANAASAAQTTANAALPKAGGNMTGPIVLPADPTASLQAATKQYVDTAASSAQSAASAAQTTANAAIPATQKGQANGVATLGSDGKVPTAQLPSLAGGGSGCVPTGTGIPFWDGTNCTPATPAQLTTAMVDPTLNTAITFSTGSNGDSTVPTPTAGKSILAQMGGVPKLSVNGASYVPLLGTVPVSCQPGIGDGNNSIPSGTYLQTSCYNDSGKTWTITGIRCFADAGSSTLSVTNGSGTSLTSTITCSTSFAAGTQTGTVTVAAGDFIKFSFVADGSAKQATFVVTGSHP